METPINPRANRIDMYACVRSFVRLCVCVCACVYVTRVSLVCEPVLNIRRHVIQNPVLLNSDGLNRKDGESAGAEEQRQGMG